MSIPRSDNRLPQLLDEAAHQFRQKGFRGCSVRDIAGAVRMLPGSLYYHFPNKEALLVAVYAQGVARISEAVRSAASRQADPWLRLEAACAAHLEALLDDSDYAQVVIRVRPQDASRAAARLTALRDSYDALFAGLVRALPLPPRTDRRALRMLLLGALNWTQTWYRPGRSSPRRIARQFVRLLAEGLRPAASGGHD
ncbi:MAG: TetR/AcrR family transcriptional regulator [Rhodocyclaceae bacterium]